MQVLEMAIKCHKIVKIDDLGPQTKAQGDVLKCLLLSTIQSC